MPPPPGPTSQRQLFFIDAAQHAGAVTMTWRADSAFVATAGETKFVHVYDRYGQAVDDISLSGGRSNPPPPCAR